MQLAVTWWAFMNGGLVYGHKRVCMALLGLGFVMADRWGQGGSCVCAC